MILNKYILDRIINLARLRVSQIRLWITVLPSNLINTYYDFFCNTHMSTVSRMKKEQIKYIISYNLFLGASDYANTNANANLGKHLSSLQTYI